MSDAAGSDAPVAHCYRHPRREALISCTRCGRPICPDCMRPASVGFHCPEDVSEARRTVRAPRTAVGARTLYSRPWVTIGLIAANVIVYLITIIPGNGGGLGDPTRSRLYYDWVMYGPFVRYQDEYYRLVTSAFLHLSLLHIASNMIALGVIGPPVERLLGHWRFSAIYALGALGGGAAVYVFAANEPTAGASGAIFAVFGACLPLVRKLGLDLSWLVGILVINFIITFALPGISQWGHIGGFVVGVLAGLGVGGLPRGERVPTRIQTAALVAMLVVLVLIVVARSVAYPA